MADPAEGGTDSTESTDQGSTEDAPKDQQSTESTEDDFDSLPEATKAEIRKLRRENRTLRKSQPKAAPADKGTDPQAALLAKLTELLGVDMGTATTKATAPATPDSGNELRTARVELAAYKAATAAGADPDALLDSRSFLREIEGLDPTDASFEKDLRDAAKAALGANPSLKAKSGGQQKTPPGKSGGDLAGGKTATQQEFLTPQQRLAAAYAANNP